MSKPIIQVENLSKLYRIGAREQGYRTFREAVMDIFTAPIRNFRRLHNLSHFDLHRNGQDTQDTIWALKDVSFEVQPGEVVGIIGRNGAGKSTLLKILSRITEPTGGEIKLFGRVSSLLEVGTGFHPELTGRENIYLNGTILGMRKSEIERKFDEIVAFSEIEKFLDTPVKRYSSGMYVRLAFAVAAHLEPEILLVDEVLAVGDAAFQKKCLGKMGDVAKEGRTVLFVSHNMAAIQTLCHRTILLENGRKGLDGPTPQLIEAYTESHLNNIMTHDLEERQDHKGNGKLRIQALSLLSKLGMNTCLAGDPVTIRFEYQWESEPLHVPSNIGFTIWTMNRQPLIECKSSYSREPIVLKDTQGYVLCDIPSLPLMPGQYLLDYCVKISNEIYDWLENALILTVVPSDYLESPKMDTTVGATILLKHKWASLTMDESTGD